MRAAWACFDGPQPWTTFGKSFAPILTLDALPGSPLIIAGGFDNTPSANHDGVELTSALYYAFDGGAGTWARGYDLPVIGIFPGQIAQDTSSVYLFTNATNGFAVWCVVPSGPFSRGNAHRALSLAHANIMNLRQPCAP